MIMIIRFAQIPLKLVKPIRLKYFVQIYCWKYNKNIYITIRIKYTGKDIKRVKSIRFIIVHGN